MIKIFINPMAKPRMTQRDKWLSPPRKVISRYNAYKDGVRLLARCQMLGEENLSPALRLDFHIECPESWSKSKIFEYSGTPHQQKPDIDNLIKAILDIFFEDDSVVYMVNAAKFWTKPGDGCILISEEKTS